MAAVIGCDIHPINNLRVLRLLRSDFSATPDQVQNWMAHWASEGLAALEILVARHGGRFSFCDDPTLADCFLVPQIYSAERFGIDLSAYPNLVRAAEQARALPAFQAAHPSLQPDADPA